MLGRLGKRIRRLRRLFSRSEWAARRLLLRRDTTLQPGAHPSGAVIIQIDGLGYRQLLDGYDKRKLPFLQRLVQQHDFVLRKMYPGPAATTAAVQAEFFYGRSAAAMIFSQYAADERQKSGAVPDIEEAHAAARRLDSTGRGLLAGGSSYANIFTGGAGKTLFCCRSGKELALLDETRPDNIAWLILNNPEKIIRAAALIFWETTLALCGFLRRLFLREAAFAQIRSTFSRIGAAIVLREYIRMHVKIDIACGLPIIHASFTGYGEHARLRGRDSACAMRSLKDTDAAIRDIVSAAIRSERRDYRIFIYSDHGQEVAAGGISSASTQSLGAENEGAEAFVILPDTISAVSSSSLRVFDLRRHILALFHKKGSAQPFVPRPRMKAKQSLTVMTYNIHSCIGIDGKLFPDRIARIIGRASPDVVALQEVDRNMARSGSCDQAKIIAAQLDMRSQFFPLWQDDGGEYGLAVLSRLPVLDTRRFFLPGLGPEGRNERRGILLTTLQTGERRLHLLNTHLSLVSRERIVQILHIRDVILADAVPPSEPLILCGDFNAGINSRTYAIISKRLQDCQRVHAQIPAEPTFFSVYPLLRLDHIFHSSHLLPASIRVLGDGECRLASDHLPLQATLRPTTGRRRTA